MTNTRLMKRAPRLDPEQQGNKVKQSEHPGTPTWVMQCRSNECAAVENNTECVELGSPFYRQIISVQNYHLSTNVMRRQKITMMYISACVLRWIIIHSFANTASTNIHRCHVHTCFESRRFSGTENAPIMIDTVTSPCYQSFTKRSSNKPQGSAGDQ